MLESVVPAHLPDICIALARNYLPCWHGGSIFAMIEGTGVVSESVVLSHFLTVPIALFQLVGCLQHAESEAAFAFILSPLESTCAHSILYFVSWPCIRRDCFSFHSPVMLVGEHMDQFENFETKRFVQRLVGRGDVTGLMDKIHDVIPEVSCACAHGHGHPPHAPSQYSPHWARSSCASATTLPLIGLSSLWLTILCALNHFFYFFVIGSAARVAGLHQQRQRDHACTQEHV